MVKMDEHFLHSNYLVCGAARELRRRLRRERMEGRLKDDTRRQNDLGPQTSSSALCIFTINSFNQCHHRLTYWGFLFLPFSIIFHLRPRNTTSSSVSEPFASLPSSKDLLARTDRPLFGKAMILRVLRYHGNSQHSMVKKTAEASPYRWTASRHTISNRWRITHRIRIRDGTVYGSCCERGLFDLIAFSTII